MKHLILAIGLVAVAVDAVAQEAQTYPAERLRISSNRSGLIDVEWGGVGQHLSFDVGLWAGVSKNPLIIYDAAQTGSPRVGALLADRVGGSLIASLGLFGWGEVGLELPVIWYQWRSPLIPGQTTPQPSPVPAIGIGDVKLTPKARFLNQDDHGINLALLLGFSIPSGGQRAYLGEAFLTFLPELAISRAFGGLRLATNLGAAIRPRSTFLNQVVESEITGRFGVGYRFWEPGAKGDLTGVPLEIDVSYFLGFSALAPFRNSNQTPMELRGMLAWTPWRPLQVFAGGGVGLSRGWGTPDWRAFFGVRFGFWDESTVHDRDGDGITDEVDKCPDVAENKNGFEDEDGCPDDPDPDHDGIIGAADKCPTQPETKNGFEDDDGCPDDADPDRDGILGAADKCPNQPEDKDGFEDADGCPDPDNDQDGVTDAVDQCPNEKGLVENRGCPDKDRDGDTVVDRLDNCPDEPGTPKNQGCKEKQLVVITASKLEILDSIYFKVGKDVIEKRSYELLDNVARVLKAHPEVQKVRIEGHTDNQGKPDANLDLSDRRAKSVMNYLTITGIDATRLEGKGYGQTKPIADNATAAGRAKNRRVVFSIVGAGEDSNIKADDSKGPTEDTIEKPKAKATDSKDKKK